MRVVDGLWRLLRGLLLVVAAIVVFIEEFGWRPLSAGLAWIARWAPLHWIEARIEQVSPKVALALFLVPAVLLFPVKLAALGVLHAGHAAWGVAIIVAAKVIGTAVVGRLFVLLEPQLCQFAWFVRALDWWRHVKAWVGAALRESRIWQGLRGFLLSGRLWLRRRGTGQR
jgi:hypothetical protein